MIDFNIYNVNVHRDELTLGWSLDLKVKFFQMGPNFDGTGREKSLFLG